MEQLNLIQKGLEEDCRRLLRSYVIAKKCRCELHPQHSFRATFLFTIHSRGVIPLLVLHRSPIFDDWWVVR